MQSSQQTEHSRNPGPCVSATPSRLSGDLALVSTFRHVVLRNSPKTPHFQKNPSCTLSKFRGPRTTTQGGTLAPSSLDSILTKIGGRGVSPLPQDLSSTSVSRLCHTHSECDTLVFIMPAHPYILVVDDEAGIRESLSSILTDEGYHVESAESAEKALERASRGDLEVILLDVWLPGMDGLEALSRLQSIPHPPAVIMISGHGSIETAVRATKLGAFDFVVKPLSLERIIVLVRNAVQQRRLEEENQTLRSELGHRYQVIGESVPMKALRQQIAVTAPTNGRVLIYGESGTGKELVARALHAASLRSKGPFVEVNCAAIPEELIESELFGHLKGSFTGASEDKTGKFQAADGGTLFLDEVGDMSLRTQAKVLRVLEEQRFEPVGSNQTVRVDVRVIAATNKELDKEIARGAFRQDLFYRLNVIPFFVPPLRDRLADIPILVRHFLNEFSSEYGKKTRELSDNALEILMRYPWPGNVRELRNLVERLVIVCPQARIEPHHLPPELFRGVSESLHQPYGTLHEARSAYEREFILRKLQENRWNMTQTAGALGLERSHLYRKMKSLGIAAPE